MYSLILGALVSLAPQGSDGPLDQRVFEIGRIEVEEAPKIDGWLDDACWRDAPVLGDLVQVEPIDGVPPSQQTIIKVVHDRRALYLYLDCRDEQPRTIRQTQRQRDADLDPDDRVEWLFDPFERNQAGYWFQIGAAGSLGDALLGPGQFNKSWDTIWEGRSQVTDRGWQAEVRLPFRSVAFPSGSPSWSFNIRRIRRSTNEQYRWNNPVQGTRFFTLAEAGTLTGLGQIDSGIGLDVVPFVAFNTSRQRLDGIDWENDPDVGGDVFYRITPSLTASLTFFTDFAQTENDSRQINLTRFPLFFPERRDFFLEDSTRFDFGANDRSLIPFFSRRIGLADGEEVPITVGAKVTGSVGKWGIGFLDVQTDTAPSVDEEKNLGVIRVTRDLGEQTRVGVIATNGRPTDRGDNTVAGVDFYHREQDLIGDQDLELRLYALGSQTSGDGGDGYATGLDATTRGNEWQHEARWRYIGSEFNPELGFVRRRGIQTFALETDWLPRVQRGRIRNLNFGAEVTSVLDTSNDVQDFEVDLTAFGLTTYDEDRFSINVQRAYERINDPFEIFDGIDILPGDYWQSRVRTRYSMSDAFPVRVEVRASYGDLFQGESWTMSTEVDWRTLPWLLLGGEYSQTQARLSGERFTSFTSEGTVDVHFNPDTSWLNLIQYDNESRNLGVQSRLRWIIRPGRDLFVVAQSGWVKGGDGNFRPDAQELSIKLAYTFRF